MNKTSWRHHYLPEFYLNGFTNPEGKFKIYDIEKKRFIKNKKEFSPHSFFFEPNGNTIHWPNLEPDDFIETKFYSHSDNLISKIFDKLKGADASSNFNLTDEDMPPLQYFVSLLFWRLPNNQKIIEYLIDKKELSELGWIVKKNKKGQSLPNKDLEVEIKNHPSIFKLMKFWLPHTSFERLLQNRTPLTIQSFSDKFPALCSDNPLIFKNSFLPDLYYDDFILPLTRRLVFIRGEQIKNEAIPSIRIDIDLILLLQANKYVSCTDDRYIDLLYNYYQNNYHSLEDLKISVFNRLIENRITN